MAKRINPETGVFEEERDILGFIPSWQPMENENGNSERINPDSGMIEEERNILGFIPSWQSKD
jgi:hypothetical protein